MKSILPESEAILKPTAKPADAECAGGTDAITLGAVSARHPISRPLPVLVSPTTKKGRNTLQQDLIVVACLLIRHRHFRRQSAFVNPSAKTVLRRLAVLRKWHPKAPASVFGHDARENGEEAAKQRSGRRADAIYAVLVHDVERWETLYQAEEWGANEIGTILSILGHDTGSAGESPDLPRLAAAISDFQGKSGLHVDGCADRETRAALFGAYFGYLFPNPMDRTDFLSQGVDSGGKGDVQGCGGYNPVVIPSHAEFTAKRARKADSDSNSRVLFLFFRPGTVIPPQEWPCPGTAEGSGNCHGRFWSDADVRRAHLGHRRLFGETQNTFSCRFYHRIAAQSPCEGVPRRTSIQKPLKDLVIRLAYPPATAFPFERSAGSILYTVICEGKEYSGTTDNEGMVREKIPADATEAVLTIFRCINGRKTSWWTVQLHIRDLMPGSTGSVSGIKARLNNLGLFAGNVEDQAQDERFQRAVRRFEQLYFPAPTALPLETIERRLGLIYGS